MFRRSWRDAHPARDGVDGRDADPALIEEIVQRALADRPAPRDGRDADPAKVRAEAERAVRSLHLRDGKDGKPGERGPRGLAGPTGPMPRHEWKGTKLRFEGEPGVWGDWVDLKGEKGPSGRDGIGGVLVQQAGVVASANSYFPSGW